MGRGWHTVFGYGWCWLCTCYIILPPCVAASWVTLVEVNATDTVIDVGSTAFNSAFNACPTLRYKRNGAVFAIYKRITRLPTDVDPYTLFTSYWSDANNLLNTDFKLYSSEADMTADSNAWTYCNYNDIDVGFPRDCDPSSAASLTWFSFPGGTKTMSGITSSATFDLYNSACGCPASSSSSTAGVFMRSQNRCLVCVGVLRGGGGGLCLCACVGVWVCVWLVGGGGCGWVERSV